MTNSNLNIPNIVSGVALLFSWFGIVFLLKDLFYASFGFILLAFVFDAFDGYLARFLGINNKLGRALDGYVDVINYLVYPAISFFLFFKLTSIFSLLSIFIFLAAGVFRLARFEVIGIKKKESKMYYEGLPVFVSPVLILFYLILSQLVSHQVFTMLATLSLILISYLMVLTFKFPKPKNIFPIIIGALILSLIFFAKQVNSF